MIWSAKLWSVGHHHYLVAVGLVNQVIGSIAAREAGDLDLQLQRLGETEGLSGT